MKYLGYSFYMMNGKCGLRLHPQSVAKMKVKLKELTSRSNGWGYAKLKDKLNQFINGWMNYFKLADMRNILQQRINGFVIESGVMSGRVGRKSAQGSRISLFMLGIGSDFLPCSNIHHEYWPIAKLATCLCHISRDS